MTEGDVAPEISTRVVSVYFKYFEHVFGRERLLEAFEEIGGTPTLPFLLDPENFVSLRYCERAATLLTARSGDPGFIQKAGAWQLSNPSMFGFAYYVMRSLGSPLRYYRMAVKMAPVYNRVSDMKLEELGRHRVRLRYRSVVPESTRLICEGRHGQIAAAPTLWGLPPAEVRELECQVNGAPACVYDIAWTEGPRPLRRGLVGGLVGGILAGLAVGTAGAVLGGLAGLFAVLAFTYRREAQTTTHRVVDSAEATAQSLNELRRRFEEVQSLHAQAEAAHRSLLEEMRRREQAEEALREAQKLEAVGRLSGGIAHDFNNILTVILGSAAHARTGGAAGTSGALPPDIIGALDDISEAARRASDLTKRLLAFARRQVIEPQVINVDEHLRQLDKMLRPLVGEDVRLEITATNEASRTNVLVDPTQLQQVIMNLAVNARDAMPRGGSLRLDTAVVQLEADDPLLGRALPPGTYVRLSVTDSGCGMDEATRQRAFEPFFTTKELGRGTGLGLATCHGIVSQAGGAITVRSAVDAGTTVNVVLPRVEATPTPRPTRSASAARGGSETILVVEDDLAVRQVVVRALGAAGYRVLEAPNAAEALARFESETDAGAREIHLLVSDIVMEGLDGRALAERLRAARPSLRVLYVSGYPRDVLSRHGVLDEGIRFLRKPFTGDELLAKVRAVLDQPTAA